MELVLSCGYDPAPPAMSLNASAVRSMFGLEGPPGPVEVARDVRLTISPGEVVLFAGPSGSGKSSLLREASSQLSGRGAVVATLDPRPAGERALVDLLEVELDEAISLLGRCGLGEPGLTLRRPGELSEGQRYRFALARCVASGAAIVVADEWCAGLDSVAARVVSRGARRLANERGLMLLAATSREDVADDLDPDCIVTCRGPGRVEVRRRRPFRREVSFLRELELCEGAATDWAYFARWHYRGKSLGPVKHVRVLFHGEEPVGICMLGPGPLGSPARNRLFALGGLDPRVAAAVVNGHFLAVTRLVLDPRYRGAGVGAALLRRSCETVSARWIEMSAELARTIPFPPSAGFVRVEVEPKRRSRAAATRPGGGPGGAYSAVNSTPAARERFRRRVRASRPAWFIRDNAAFA